jgi:hypothetical protein
MHAAQLLGDWVLRGPYSCSASPLISQISDRSLKNYHRIEQIKGDDVSQEAVLAALPDSRDDAKSLKEIANEMGIGFEEMGLCGSGAQAERRGPAVLV